MNPFIRFRDWITKEAMSKTDDVFEQAKIRLTYNFTLFFFVLGFLFYVNLIIGHYWLQVYVTTFALVVLPMVFVVLKKTGNARYAAYLFVFTQIVMTIANMAISNFDINAEGAFWSITLIFFTFTVLDARWGWTVIIVDLFVVPFGLINKAHNFAYFHLNISPGQLAPAAPAFIVVPMLIIGYGFYQLTRTRNMAEQKINAQKKELERSNKLLETKNEDIISSINYARRIQTAVLPNEENIYRNFPQSFVFYRPRDIVSGDFFWFHEIDRNNQLIVAADCTGHGVPGAFMTVIGSSSLNQVVVENRFTKPGRILTALDERITSTLHQEKVQQGYVQDGMDISVIAVDRVKKEIVFASAKRPAFFFRNGELQEIKGSKSTLGGLRSEEKIFPETVINYSEGDVIYLFTDGIVDQFGGRDNKKFTTKRFRELLASIAALPVTEQREKMKTAFENWKGNYEQTDDVLVIGIRF